MIWAISATGGSPAGSVSCWRTPRSIHLISPASGWGPGTAGWAIDATTKIRSGEAATALGETAQPPGPSWEAHLDGPGPELGLPDIVPRPIRCL